MSCPNCGHPNSILRTHCEKCGSYLPDVLGKHLKEAVEKAEEKPKRKRKHNPDIPTQCPHCGYVGLLTDEGNCARCHTWINFDQYTQESPLFTQRQITGILRVAFLFGCFAIVMLPESFWFFLLFMGIAVGFGALALGLGTMKKWGRNLAIMLAIIGLLYSLYSASIKGLVGFGALLFWLLSNSQRFTD